MRSFSLVPTTATSIGCWVFLFWGTTTDAWTPQTRLIQTRSILPSSFTTAAPLRSIHSTPLSAKFGNDDEIEPFFPFSMASTETDPVESNTNTNNGILYDHEYRALMIGVVTLLSAPAMASAAGPGAIPSALAAYVHYLSLLLMTGSIMTERLTVKPNMSIEEEKLLGTADILTGVAGTLLLASGYYRATDLAYGKGWDFYSHEPLFWLKLALLGVFGGLSLFPTITIIQRTVKIQQEGTIEPMSEALANRMKKVMNAELTALASIPLTATFMARGIGYVDDFPTQIVGPVFFALITGGAVYKYVKDAITWKEGDVVAATLDDDN